MFFPFATFNRVAPLRHGTRVSFMRHKGMQIQPPSETEARDAAE